MSIVKKFLGQTALYGLSNIASRILSFFLTPLYTNVYSPAVFGVFTILYSYASLLNALLAFGMETTYFRFLNREEDKEKVYSNSFWGVASVAFLFLLLGLSSADAIADWLQGKGETEYGTYVRFFVWILFIDALCVIPFAKLRAENRPARYSLIKVLNILVFIGLNLFFILFIPFVIKNEWPFHEWFAGVYVYKWVGYVFIANLVANSLTLLLLLPEFRRLRFSFSWGMLNNMLSYSWPILIANISFIINENLDKILLSHYLPAGIADVDVGVYGACCKLSIFMNIFIQAFRLGAEPFFFSHAKNKNAPKTYATIMHYFIIAVCLIFVGLTANLSWLKHFIGNRYWEGLRVVPILLFAYVCLGIYMNLSIWYKLSDQTRYGFYISAVGAALTIILNILFIPKYSYIASAWASMIAYFSMMVLSYVLGQQNYPIPYKLRAALIYLTISGALVGIIFVLFNSDFLIGNGLLLLFVVFIVLRERTNFNKLRMAQMG